MTETIQEVTGKTAGEYFVRLDALVAPDTVLYVYGGALPRFRRERTAGADRRTGSLQENE